VPGPLSIYPEAISSHESFNMMANIGDFNNPQLEIVNIVTILSPFHLEIDPFAG
jgi:hypothetical protein